MTRGGRQASSKPVARAGDGRTSHAESDLNDPPAFRTPSPPACRGCVCYLLPRKCRRWNLGCGSKKREQRGVFIVGHPTNWIENISVRSIVWKRVVKGPGNGGKHSLITARHEHKKTIMMPSFTPLTAEPTIGPGVCEFAMELWNSIFLTLVRSLDCLTLKSITLCAEHHSQGVHTHTHPTCAGGK